MSCVFDHCVGQHAGGAVGKCDLLRLRRMLIISQIGPIIAKVTVFGFSRGEDANAASLLHLLWRQSGDH